jgi:Asp/Glu/hydantoin racemase
VTSRILFLNPIGTDMYNEYTSDLLGPRAAPDTEIETRNLDGLPETPFMPPLPMFRDQLFDAVGGAEREGFDAVVISCTADPWVREAKEIVDIPVTGPFEALAHTAPTLGPVAIVASGYKIETWQPRAYDHGLEGTLTSVRMADFAHPSEDLTKRLFATDVPALRELVMEEMVRSVEDDGVDQSKLAATDDGAASVFFACTFWSGLLGPVVEAVPDVTVLDPLELPLRYAEYLAAVHRSGGPEPVPAGDRSGR